MPIDKFEDYTAGLESPPTYISDIVPDDVSDLASATRAINVAAPGVVQVTTTEGSISNVFIAAGVAFPLRVIKVWATGTTAIGIRGLY
ncbi:MAG: hypothetical protein ABJO67_16415 [Pseudoruegeria sp.]